RRAEQQGRDQTRHREHHAPAPLRQVGVTAAAAPVAPERKRGATQYDADQDKGQGDVQQGPEPGERGRKAGEEQHQREDEPDVVRLPEGADGLGDELALPLLTWTAGDNVPDATANSRPPEK